MQNLSINLNDYTVVLITFPSAEQQQEVISILRQNGIRCEPFPGDPCSARVIRRVAVAITTAFPEFATWRNLTSAEVLQCFQHNNPASS